MSPEEKILVKRLVDRSRGLSAAALSLLFRLQEDKIDETPEALLLLRIGDSILWDARALEASLK
jgi:hypothetical protein